MNICDRKVIILCGFYDTKGKTAKLLDAYLELLPPNLDIDVYNAYQCQVKPCIGCEKCRDGNACIYNDMIIWTEKLINSDAIIVVSPTYNFTFTPPLLSFFSRLQPYFLNLKRNKSINILGKKKAGVLLITCGGDDELPMEIMTKQMKRIFSTINTELNSTVSLGMTDEGFNIDLVDKDLEKSVKQLTDLLK